MSDEFAKAILERVTAAVNRRGAERRQLAHDGAHCVQLADGRDVLVLSPEAAVSLKISFELADIARSLRDAFTKEASAQ